MTIMVSSLAFRMRTTIASDFIHLFSGLLTDFLEPCNLWRILSKTCRCPRLVVVVVNILPEVPQLLKVLLLGRSTVGEQPFRAQWGIVDGLVSLLGKTTGKEIHPIVLGFIVQQQF